MSTDTRHAGKRVTIAPGIYRDNFGFGVIASVGSGDRRLTSPEIRFRFEDGYTAADRPSDQYLATMQARWHREKMRLKDEQSRAGGPLVRGLVSGDVARYLQTATLSKQRRAERTVQLAWWAARFGKRRRAAIESAELLQALNGLTKANGKPATPSTKNKYRHAFSHVWTILDGKNAANPFRDVKQFNEGEPLRRDQSYELIDAIIVQLRDRGQGTKPSRSKAFLMVEAYAPVTRAQLVRMTSGDIDWTASTIQTPGRKKGAGTRGQVKHLSADALEAFRRFDAAGCWGVKPSKSSIWRTFRDARDRAIAELKVSRPDLDLSRAATMRPYDLRHSFATEAARVLRNESLVGTLLDHQDLRTTKRYTQGVIPDHMRVAGEAVAAAFATRPKYQPPLKQTTTPAPKLAIRLVKRAKA